MSFNNLFRLFVEDVFPKNLFQLLVQRIKKYTGNPILPQSCPPKIEAGRIVDNAAFADCNSQF